MINKQDDTVNYSDPEARKSPNKEGVTQTGYNEQIVIDNKNGLIIAVDVTTDGNNQKQLMPMIEKSEENIQKALNLTPEEFQEQCSDIDVLFDYGYFSYDQVEKAENQENITLYLSDKGLASEDKDKDKLRRPSNRKKNNKKRYGKNDMSCYDKNHCYLCPNGQTLEQKKIYHLKHTQIQTISSKRLKKCKYRTITHGNSIKHDKNTQYRTKHTKIKYNINRDINFIIQKNR